MHWIFMDFQDFECPRAARTRSGPGSGRCRAAARRGTPPPPQNVIELVHEVTKRNETPYGGGDLRCDTREWVVGKILLRAVPTTTGSSGLRRSAARNGENQRSNFKKMLIFGRTPRYNRQTDRRRTDRPSRPRSSRRKSASRGVPPSAPPHSNKFVQVRLVMAWRVFRFRIPVGGDRSALRKIPAKVRFERVVGKLILSTTGRSCATIPCSL